MHKMEVQYCKWVHVIEVLVYRTTWCLLLTAAEEFRKPNFCYILRKKIRNTNSARKFKLFDSQSRYKTNADEILVKDQSNNFNETLHESFGESNTPTISLCENDSFRFVCRRIKSRSKHGSAPKRFKLI